MLCDARVKLMLSSENEMRKTISNAKKKEMQIKVSMNKISSENNNDDDDDDVSDIVEDVNNGNKSSFLKMCKQVPSLPLVYDPPRRVVNEKDFHRRSSTYYKNNESRKRQYKHIENGMYLIKLNIFLLSDYKKNYVVSSSVTNFFLSILDNISQIIGTQDILKAIILVKSSIPIYSRDVIALINIRIVETSKGLIMP